MGPTISLMGMQSSRGRRAAGPALQSPDLLGRRILLAANAMTISQTKGGAFLIEDRAPEEIFTAEDLNEQHHDIARTVVDFWA